MRIAPDWLAAPALRRVFDALGGRVWAVGGCVRNTLLEMPVDDVDLCTPLRPDAVVAALEAAGLRAVPTGIEHGTVTAVADGEGFEITTFRADVETDGRRAVVRFSDSIGEDALRRDFTVNALYCAPDGEVADPVGGLDDIAARRIRFIGDAHDRIREDYLRILRFFRFHAWYGADGIDPDGLAACAELAEGIGRLARERIGHEMRKLLAAPDPAPALAAMQASGVLMRCLPGADVAAIAPLVHLEGLAGAAPDWRARLVALGGEDPAAAWRLSNRDARDEGAIRAVASSGEGPAASAYRHGADIARAGLLVRAASTGAGLPEGLEAEITRGASAVFPLRAEHLMARGMEPGPALGAALAKAEAAWIDSGFALDREALAELVG